MSILSRNQEKTIRRERRNKNKVKRANRTLKPRASVSRSLNAISIQIIDDVKHHTLLSGSTLQIDVKGNKTEQAKQLGIEVAKKALENSINEIVFDRGAFKYHGRVKALADGLREGGLKF